MQNRDARARRKRQTSTNVDMTVRGKKGGKDKQPPDEVCRYGRIWNRRLCLGLDVCRSEKHLRARARRVIKNGSSQHAWLMVDNEAVQRRVQRWRASSDRREAILMRTTVWVPVHSQWQKAAHTIPTLFFFRSQVRRRVDFNQKENIRWQECTKKLARRCGIQCVCGVCLS